MSPALAVILALFVLAYGSVLVFAMRNPVLGRLAVREAIRRRGHSLLVVAGLMVGTATMTAALVGGDSVSASATDAFAYRNWGHIDLTVSASNRLFSQDVAADIAADSAVKAKTDGVSGTIELAGSAADLTTRQGSSRVTLVGFDPDTQAAFGPFQTTHGSTTTGADLFPDTVLVSRVLADKIDAERGHQIRFSAPEAETRTLTVAGVVRAEGPGAYTLGSVLFTTLETAQAITGTPGQINVVRVSAPGGIRDSVEAGRAAEPVVRAAVTKIDPSLAVRNAKGAEVESAKTFTGFIRAMLLGMSSLVVAAGAALIVNLIGMLAEERRSRLGVMRALGLRRRRLIGLSVTEGAIYSLAAGVVGSLLGIGVGRVVAERFARAFATFAGEDFDFTFFFSLEPATVLTGFALGSFLTLGIVTLASRRTARMTITAAIRDLPEPPAEKARRRWVRPLRLILGAVLGAAMIASGQAFPRIVGGIALLLVVGSLLKGRLSARTHATLLGLALAAWAFVAISAESPEDDAGAFFSTFVVAMLSAVYGLTTLVAAQLSLLERVVGAVSGRLRVVLRPPLAYLARRPTRTGLTTGVFAVIIAMLTLFAVFFVIFRPDYQQFGNGYDVRILSTGSAEIAVPADVQRDVTRSVLLPTRGYIGPVKSEDDFSNSERTLVPIYEAPDKPPVGFERRSEQYDTDEEAWRAMLADPTVVITNFTTPDMSLTLQGAEGPVEFTSAGAQRFGLLDGIFASRKTLEQFESAPLGAVMLLDVADERRAHAIARSIEATLFEKGVDADSVLKLLDDADRANRAFFSTIDVLMRMGLVVGILALGIVALRVVIERRHIIGVLRALGYKKRSVMAGLMAEAGLTVAIGTFVGVVVGLTMGYVFYRQEDAQTGFGVDGGALFGVIGLVFVAVLLVTAGPAWRASRLPPAEAVRYSE